jgi:sialate O-acetylesterase
MVLQQRCNATIWGWAKPGDKVSVSTSWNGVNYTVTAAADSSWAVDVKTPSASYNEYTLTIKSAGKSIKLENVVIGEVWLGSGQSNMYMPMKGYGSQPTEGGPEAIRKSNNRYIRMVNVPNIASSEVEKEVAGNWKLSSPTTTPEFSATAYFFAKYLQEMLDIPVGVIHTSWGGSKIQCWMPRWMLKDFGEDMAKVDQEINAKDKRGSTRSCVLYNAMLQPLHRYDIKGFIWYQGCSNRHQKSYADYQVAMVNHWRDLWNNKSLPFYYVQISPYEYNDVDPNSAAKFRDIQTSILQKDSLMGMVCTMDLLYEYEKDCIHPRQKQKVGERLALLALERDYGVEGMNSENPSLSSVEYVNDGNRAVLSFKNIANGFWFEGPVRGFTVAGKDKVFYPAEVTWKNDHQLYVFSPKVSKIEAIRYLYGSFVIANLWNTAGMPILPFRTDNWEDSKIAR